MLLGKDVLGLQDTCVEREHESKPCRSQRCSKELQRAGRRRPRRCCQTGAPASSGQWGWAGARLACGGCPNARVPRWRSAESRDTRVAPHGARGASQRDAGSLWKNDRSRLAMRSDFLYSQIVLRGGSLETCSSRGIFRRTDKLHVGFRPNFM